LVYANSIPKYLKYLDNLFSDLYAGGCIGIDTKVAEVATISKFEALISELNFARYFTMKKWQVELLPSNAFQNRKSPDMLVKNAVREYFVEVKNIQFDDEDYEFGVEIANLLNSAGLSFVVVVKASSQLSKPAYKYQSKETKEEISKKALIEFKSQIKGIKPQSKQIEIKTSAADIELIATGKGKSYMGIGTMKEAISEPPEYAERIKYDILNKSAKRKDWQGSELDKLYIVAIDDPSLMFYVDRYNAELFGNVTCFIPPLPVPNPTIDPPIQNALNRGWKDYLLKMCVLPNGRSVLPDNQRRLFFNEPLLENTTAVLVMHRNAFYLLANPFAENRINTVDVLADMADCFTGWE
jgi:hypothetical protein